MDDPSKWSRRQKLEYALQVAKDKGNKHLQLSLLLALKELNREERGEV